MNAKTAKRISYVNNIKKDKKKAKLELKKIKKNIKQSVKDGDNCCCYNSDSNSLYDTTAQWLKNNGYSYEYVESLWLGYIKISWR